MIRRIEIQFEIPVEPEDVDYRDLEKIITRICDRACPEGFVYWPSGMGLKPIWSKADCRIFGFLEDSRASEAGEPSFDNKVYFIKMCAREAWPEEIVRRKAKAEAVERRRSSFRFRLANWIRRSANWVSLRVAG